MSLVPRTATDLETAPPAPPEKQAERVLRPELDVLRFLAIIGLAYHADVPGFDGGFVALEFFFVTSGYLITAQIVGGVLKGHFSLWEFYTRRVRRLLPAALFTLVAFTVLWWIFLPAYRAAEAAREAAWSAVPLGNVFFYRNTDYFEDFANTKPFLIMWSLSLEEQWYAVWPLLLLLLLAVFRRKVWMAITVVIVVASTGTILMTAHDQAAAYYMMPFRAFGFAIGALCVFIPPIAQRLRGPTMLLGLSLMIGCVVFYDETYAYPGYLALVPCAGVAFYIISGCNKPAWFFQNKVFVKLGQATYSAFLIHFPIIVTIREFNHGVLDWKRQLLILFLVIVLGVLMTRYIEKPWRVIAAPTTPPGPRRFFTVAGPFIALAFVLSAAFHYSYRYLSEPERYPAELRHIAAQSVDDVNKERVILQKKICHEFREDSVCGEVDPDRRNVLVIGDSLGIDGLNLTAAMDPDANILVSAIPACPPYHLLRGVGSQHCATANQARLERVAELAPQVDTVFLSAGAGGPRLKAAVEIVHWLKDQGANDVAVLGVGPFYTRWASQIVLSKGFDDAGPELWASLRSNASYDAESRGALEGAGARYLSRFDLQCHAGSCVATVDKQTVMHDADHLTLPGVAWLAEQMAAAGDRI